jgi:hypothetical protein
MSEPVCIKDFYDKTHNWAARCGGWRMRDDVFEWLQENMPGRWNCIGTNWWFDTVADAVMFKIRWGGE